MYVIEMCLLMHESPLGIRIATKSAANSDAGSRQSVTSAHLNARIESKGVLVAVYRLLEGPPSV